MKKHYFVVLALATILFSGCTAASMSVSVSGGNQRAIELNRRIQEQNFTIDVWSASPSGWRTVHLAPRYRLSVWGNLVDSRLPYFGRRAHFPPGRNSGLSFHSTTHDYRVSTNRRGVHFITFSSMSFNDRHTFRIKVEPNGSCIIDVHSTRRLPITFRGNMRF